MEKVFLLKEYKHDFSRLLVGIAEFFLYLYSKTEDNMLKKEFKFVSEQEINLMYDCSTAAYTLRRMEDERFSFSDNLEIDFNHVFIRFMFNY